eukprot:365130-Chlamydomonas_euryale.AAC.8
MSICFSLHQQGVRLGAPCMRALLAGSGRKKMRTQTTTCSFFIVIEGKGDGRLIRGKLECRRTSEGPPWADAHSIAGVPARSEELHNGSSADPADCHRAGIRGEMFWRGTCTDLAPSLGLRHPPGPLRCAPRTHDIDSVLLWDFSLACGAWSRAAGGLDLGAEGCGPQWARTRLARGPAPSQPGCPPENDGTNAC